jgi:hypothetical protein
MDIRNILDEFLVTYEDTFYQEDWGNLKKLPQSWLSFIRNTLKLPIGENSELEEITISNNINQLTKNITNMATEGDGKYVGGLVTVDGNANLFVWYTLRKGFKYIRQGDEMTKKGVVKAYPLGSTNYMTAKEFQAFMLGTAKGDDEKWTPKRNGSRIQLFRISVDEAGAEKQSERQNARDTSKTDDLDTDTHNTRLANLKMTNKYKDLFVDVDQAIETALSEKEDFWRNYRQITSSDSAGLTKENVQGLYKSMKDLSSVLRKAQMAVDKLRKPIDEFKTIHGLRIAE